MSTRTATLRDGRTVSFVEVADPPQGGMKKVYFSPDKSYVVAFFHDAAAAADPNRLARLEAVLTRFNPTTDAEVGKYWQTLFCWPSGIVARPTLGVVAPAYPANFFFATGPFQGKEKKSNWFTTPKLRKYLPEAERGTLQTSVLIGMRLARAVRRLHQAGLAHSDLSCNNVLIDPVTGQCVVIDIDSLVVPGMFAPDVLGTRGYIAPEVVRTQHLKLADPQRSHPNARTDLHALAVLLYEYLLLRRPLDGPKIHSAASTEEDEKLAMGAGALFIEHPSDGSNRPTDLVGTLPDLGPALSDLFLRAFVKGLHSPNDRPPAIEWERALVRTWDLLVPCANPKCDRKGFVAGPRVSGCPFCKTKLAAPVPVLKLRKEARPGQWVPDATLVVHGTTGLFGWHAFDNVYPGEKADRTRLGYFAFHQGAWVLVNEKLDSLTAPDGNRVPLGGVVELKPGATLRLSREKAGRMAEVEFYPTT